MVLKLGGINEKSHPVLLRAGLVHSYHMSKTIWKVISKVNLSQNDYGEVCTGGSGIPTQNSNGDSCDKIKIRVKLDFQRNFLLLQTGIKIEENQGDIRNFFLVQTSLYPDSVSPE